MYNVICSVPSLFPLSSLSLILQLVSQHRHGSASQPRNLYTTTAKTLCMCTMGMRLLILSNLTTDVSLIRPAA